MTTPISSNRSNGGSLASVSGLISGIDTQGLVDQIIAADAIPATQARTRAASLQTKQDLLGQMSSLVQTLQTAAKGLGDGSYLATTITSTTLLSGTRNVVSGVASPSAALGSYTVAVQSLARAQKLGSTAVADPTAALGAGYAGTFTVNGKAVTVTATDTLQTLRDAINAANTGGSPSGVTASIVQVAAGNNQLILTSDKAGAAGATLVETSGAPLQQLGILQANGSVAAGAVRVAGQDAQFTIDGLAFTRTSNVVSDAIPGVTLTLQNNDAGASTQVTVSRATDSITANVQKFVDAYNGVVAALKQQGTAGTNGAANPPLYNEPLLTALRAQLPAQLLTTVPGAAPDLATAATIGISLQKDGTLKLDTTKLQGALNTRFADVQKLLKAGGSATGAGLSLVTSAQLQGSGTYAVNITQAATQATLTSSGFSGTYDAGTAPDTLQVTDSASNKTISVSLTNGMTTQQIVDAINTAATTAGAAFTATVSGTNVQIVHNFWGKAGGLAIGLQDGGGGGTSKLFTTPQVVKGVDVAGTINGEAATGAGQTLVAKDGTGVAGLTVQYTGVATGAVGSVTTSVGTGALLERLAAKLTDSVNGSIVQKQAEFKAQQDALNDRADQIDARNQRIRQSLLAQFAKMESTIALLKQQTSGLTAMTNVQNTSK